MAEVGSAGSSIRHVVLRATSLVALFAVAAAPYTVEAGDTLSEIAERHGVRLETLIDANDIVDPDHIRAGDHLEVPAGQGITGSGQRTASGAQVEALVDRVAAEWGWSPAFVKALAWQESGWDNSQVSSAGAIGIMQVMPGTGAFVSEHLLGRSLDLTDPEDNVVAGIAFLQHLWELTGGDPEETLAGYYQGLRSVRVNGRYPSTERYIANVLALRDRFR